MDRRSSSQSGSSSKRKRTGNCGRACLLRRKKSGRLDRGSSKEHVKNRSKLLRNQNKSSQCQLVRLQPQRASRIIMERQLRKHKCLEMANKAPGRAQLLKNKKLKPQVTVFD